MATTLATPAELAAIAQQKLRSLVDPGGTGAVDLSPGSRNDNMISVNTALYTRAMQYIADRLTARSLSTATGDDLDALVADVYQDSRKPATAATGYIYLTRTNTGATSIPFGTQFTVPPTSTQPSISFIASADVPVGSGVLTATVPLTCTQLDETGNVLASLITVIKDNLPDTSWTVNTVAAGNTYMAGGASQENDDTFRARIQQSAFDDSKRRGTKAALQAGSLRVPGVVNVTIVEPGDGTVLVFCGDSNYNISSVTTQAVQTELENWRAFGIPALVRPYLVVTTTINATVYMQQPLQNYNYSGGSGSIQSQALSNIKTYFANRKRPDEFFGSAISSAVQSAHPEAQQVILNSVTVSSGPTPDSTNSVKRVPDGSYGSVLSMVRYIVSDASLQVNVSGPSTK